MGCWCRLDRGRLRCGRHVGAKAIVPTLDSRGSMERVQLNLGTQAVLRALERGDVKWTLHPACEFTSDPGQWGFER